MSHEPDVGGPPPMMSDRDGPGGGRGDSPGPPPGRDRSPDRGGERRRRSRSYSPDGGRRRPRSRSRSPPRRRDRSYSPDRGDRRYRDGGGGGRGGYRGDYGPPPGRGPPPPGRGGDYRGGYDDYRGDYPPPPRYDSRDGPPRGDYGPPPGYRGGGPPRGGGGGGGRREPRRRGPEEGLPGVSLLVRNVSPEITTQDLQRAFGRIGEIRDVYIPRDYHSQQPKGFAFIEYATADQAEEARDEMDRFVIKGRELEVVFAQEKRKTPNEMRGRVVNQQNRGRDRSNFERSSSYERHRREQQDGPSPRNGGSVPPEGEPSDRVKEET